MQLLGFLGQSGPSEQELTEAAAEALLYVTFRCNASKLQVLELIQQNKDGPQEVGGWLGQKGPFPALDEEGSGNPTIEIS